jgi:uncharacterized protein YecE (DUF72 family)
MTVYIGASGWQYDDWRGRFYPGETAKRRWLEHYAERFAVVESNNAFYRLPKRETFADWAARTPSDFIFAVKVSRYLTHVRRLSEPAEPVKRFLDHSRGLGEKLSVALLQLPPTLKCDLSALDRTLASFSGSVRVAVEFRHESWFNDESRSLLAERGAALCLTDRGSRPTSPLWRTAPWGYVRFHEGAASPRPCYGRSALETWARRIASLWTCGEAVYCFFNNDHIACAVRNARMFSPACERAGLDPTRVPGRGPRSRTVGQGYT